MSARRNAVSAGSASTHSRTAPDREPARHRLGRRGRIAGDSPPETRAVSASAADAPRSGVNSTTRSYPILRHYYTSSWTSTSVWGAGAAARASARAAKRGSRAARRATRAATAGVNPTPDPSTPNRARAASAPERVQGGHLAGGPVGGLGRGDEFCERQRRSQIRHISAAGARASTSATTSTSRTSPDSVRTTWCHQREDRRGEPRPDRPTRAADRTLPLGGGGRWVPVTPPAGCSTSRPPCRLPCKSAMPPPICRVLGEGRSPLPQGTVGLLRWHRRRVTVAA